MASLHSNILKKTSSYFYDAVRRRFKKEIVDHQNSANSFSRKYQYDGQEILVELDEYNSTLAVYTHSSLRTDDVLSVDIRSTKLATQEGSYFYLKDALGSIIDVTNSSGNIVQHYIYSSFGKLLSIQDQTGVEVTQSAPLKTSYTYTNREYDEESGMYYYRARYYEPSIGRFIQEDPDVGEIIFPASFLNKFSYVANGPIVRKDPSARIIPFLIAGVIAGLVKGALTKEGNFFANFAQGFAIGFGGAVFTAAFATVAIAGAGMLGFTSATAATVAGALGGGYRKHGLFTFISRSYRGRFVCCWCTWSNRWWYYWSTVSWIYAKL